MKRVKKAICLLLCGLLCTSSVLTARAEGDTASKENQPWTQSSDQFAGVLGWQGDKDAAIAYPEGSFKIRDGRDVTVGFHIADGMTGIQWYNAEDYLPCLISEFSKEGCTVQIKNFGDKVTIDSNDYVAIYSRVSIKNDTEAAVTIAPEPSSELMLRLTPDASTTVQPGETVNHDYVTAVDRFGNGGKYDWPADDALKAVGTWDERYTHMKEFWMGRISRIAQLNIPDTEMRNAYYSTFIQYNIIKDPDPESPGNNKVQVGENGYDSLWVNDMLEMVSSMLQFGEDPAVDLKHNLGISISSYDAGANWKIAWPWALYLLKTGDIEFVRENYDALKPRIHTIEEERTGPDGVMKESWIDTWGSWTMGNWNALIGLMCWEYISNALGETAEAEWAADLYVELKEACENKLLETMANNSIDYIPADILQPNSANRTGNQRDANWAVHLFNGRWPWEGYLIGADQEGVMKDYIDNTYDFGLGRLVGDLPAYDFGGFPGYASAYNASYGSSALLGERYRSVGIYAYQFMLQNTQNSPYGWWESLWHDPNDAGAWAEGSHNDGGVGSCPHMWGQVSANKVLMDSIISEKFDHTLIVGRGVPDEWLQEGKVTEVTNFPSDGKRVGAKIESLGNNQIKLTMLGDTPSGSIQFDLPLFLNGNLESATAGTVDKEAGSVVIPADTTEVTVTVKSLTPEKATDGKYEAENAELNGVSVYPNQQELEVSGTGYVAMQKTTGISVSFTVNVPQAGEYVMTTRYANANYDDTTISLSVNGGKSQMVLPTGVPGDWNKWDFHTQKVSLNAGDNTIQFQVEEADTTNFYHDYIRISQNNDEALAQLRKVINRAEDKERLDYTGESFAALKTAAENASKVLANTAATFEQINEATASVNTALKNLVGVDESIKQAVAQLKQKIKEASPSMDNILYPAALRLPLKKAITEGNTLLSEAQSPTFEEINAIIQAIDAAVAGLTEASGSRYEAEDATKLGSATVMTDHLDYSGTGFIANIRPVGSGVEFTPAITEPGEYNLVFRYANGGGEASGSIFVNGSKIKQVVYPGSGSWDTWTTVTEKVTIDSVDDVKIKMVTDEGDIGAYNLDCMDIVKAEADKEALIDAIIAAEALDKDEYMEEGFKAMQEALDAAKTVLNDLNATAQQAADAADALVKAMDKLEGYSYLKTLLKDTIDAAELAKQNYPEHLIEAVRIKFEAALDEAWRVYKDAAATDEQILAADDNLILMMQYLSFTADPTGLQEAIAFAKTDAASGKYVENDKLLAYNNLISSAEELLKNEYATDTEYAEMILALQNAAKELTLKPEISLNLTVLEHQLGLAKLIKLEDYIDGEAKDAFNAAYDKAKDVYAKAQNKDETVTQADVDKAAEELHNALMKLRLVPSKDKLEGLLKDANARDLTKYTKESGAALKAAIANAQSVYDDPQADIEMVKTAEGVLQAAIDNLVPIKNGGDKPGSDTPTGDAPFTSLIVLTSLCGAAMIVLHRRER